MEMDMSQRQRPRAAGILAVGILVVIGVSAATAGPRDVQFSEVNTTTGVVTLFNYGAREEPLTGFRLCTANTHEMFRYTASSGLAGRTIAAGGKFFIHFQDDAPASADAIDVSALGGFTALPIDNGPYGLSIYRTSSFIVPENMNDYLQWTDDLANPGNDTADARAPIATMADLWTGLTDWIVTTDTTEVIRLADESGAELHGPDDYELIGKTPPCPTDVDGSSDTGFGDLLNLLAYWGKCAPKGDCPTDIDGNGRTGFEDLLAVLTAWGPCPE